MMVKLVLDTNVLVSAFRSRRGASNALLQMGDEGRFQIVVSTALYLEYREVLSRPEIRDATGHSLEDIDAVLNALATFAIGVDIPFRTRPAMSDADDEMVLEAAVNGSADAIVTHNVRDFAAARIWKVEVVKPGKMVRRLRND